jgi:hypothetical protein
MYELALIKPLCAMREDAPAQRLCRLEVCCVAQLVGLLISVAAVAACLLVSAVQHMFQGWESARFGVRGTGVAPKEMRGRV